MPINTKPNILPQQKHSRPAPPASATPLPGRPGGQPRSATPLPNWTGGQPQKENLKHTNEPYTGPVNDFGLRPVSVDGSAQQAVTGMDSKNRGTLDRQLGQLGLMLGGADTGIGKTGGTGGRAGGAGTGKTGRLSPYDRLDTGPMREQILAGQQAALAQQQAKTDYATRQAATQLSRAEQDAARQYQQQRDAVAIDEAQALDNSALYAELRGDRGGIGQAQYNSIQNTAAGNRQAIRQAQTKLATDTARQIADLRAQGEFEKADALLQNTQNTLAQLMQLEQYALDYNLNVDKLNNAIAQWQYDADRQAQRDALSDSRYADELAYSRELDKLNQAARLAEAMLEQGIPLTDTQRAALGLTVEQENELANLYAAQRTAKNSRGGGSVTGALFAQLYNGHPEWTLKDNYYDAYNFFKKSGFTDGTAQDAASAYFEWIAPYVQA